MKEKYLALIVAVAGVGVVLSPLPVAPRLVVGLTSGSLCVVQGLEIRNRKERERATQQQSAESVGAALARREEELRVKERRLQEDLDALAIAEHQISLKGQNQLSELKAQEESLLIQLKVEEDKRRAQLEQNLELERESALQRLNTELGELQGEIEALEEEREQRLEQTSREIEKLRLEWEQTQANEIDKISRELEEAEQALIQKYCAERDQLLEELQELQQQLKAEARKEYESWLIPHCQEMDVRLREIEGLKSTVQMLKEQIAEDRDLKLCNEWGTVHGDRANSILTWLKENGQYCDYQSATVMPDGTFVLNFLPWVVGAKAEKGIKSLLLAMQVRYGLHEPPVFQPNGEARAWTLTMFPARGRAIALEDFYNQVPQETLVGESFRDIEPMLRDRVAQQLNYQQQVAEMMAFRPPVPLQRPRSHQITELEMMCCRWFYSWRALATDGSEPNITTREGLLYYVYGVREGRATSQYDPLMAEKLGDRVKRILRMLNLEAVQIEAEEGVES